MIRVRLVNSAGTPIKIRKVNPTPASLSLTVRGAIDADGALFDKTASQLQANISVTSNQMGGVPYYVIGGTLHYVTSYEAFQGDEQNGNFLALHVQANKPGTTITAQISPSTSGTGPVTLDPDGLVVFRVANKDGQIITVTGTNGSETVTRSFVLTGLTCEHEPSGGSDLTDQDGNDLVAPNGNNLTV